MEPLVPSWETWAQERFWRVPYSFRINPPRKKASQTSVKPFCMEKSIPHQAVRPALTLTPGRYALYFPFFSALK